MSRPKVMITDFISGGLEREQRILGDLADIIALKADLEEEMFGRIEDILKTHKLAKGGEQCVITLGVPIGAGESTNLLKIHNVA